MSSAVRRIPQVVPPSVLQVVGLAAFVFFVGFWAITGRVEPTLLAASGTLCGAGLLRTAVNRLEYGEEELDRKEDAA